MRIPVTVIATILVHAASAGGDAPLGPPSKVTVCSPADTYCATAHPSPKAVTTVYRKGAAGKVLWRVSDWSRVIAVSDSGQHLVTCYDGMNLLPLDYEASWPMITFYQRGSLVRSLSLKEVVVDLSKLRRTVSHYNWGNCEGFVGDFKFAVEVEGRGTVYYDARTGKAWQ